MSPVVSVCSAGYSPAPLVEAELVAKVKSKWGEDGKSLQPASRGWVGDRYPVMMWPHACSEAEGVRRGWV